MKNKTKIITEKLRQLRQQKRVTKQMQVEALLKNQSGQKKNT